MMGRMNMRLGLLLICLPFVFGCSIINVEQAGTLVAPPAQTLASRGGQIAQTQAAKLLQTAQIAFATESSNLRETAKAQAATLAASYLETAQAGLVTQSAGQITQGPTQIAELRQTALAVAGTQAADKLPLLQTQAAVLWITLQARMGTQVPTPFPVEPKLTPQPPVEVTPTLDLQATQAALLTQIAQNTPVPPVVLPDSGTYIPPQATPLETPVEIRPLPEDIPFPGIDLPRTYIANYTVQPGDTLAKIARRFSIKEEGLRQLNLQRFISEGINPDQLEPGTLLLVRRHPGSITFPPVIPPELRQSNNPACNVQGVDWLQPPVTCEPYVFRVVTAVEHSPDCVTRDNPLGYQLTQTVYSGWLLLDAANTLSYGWFYNQAHEAVVIGPAVIAGQASYQECRPPR